MELDKELAQNLEVKVSIVGGKVLLTLEFDGADAVLDGLKVKLPSWLGPLVDLAKKEVDSL